MKFNLMDLGPKTRGNSAVFKLHLPRIDKEARVLIVGDFCNWEPENSISMKYDSENDLWKGTLEEAEPGKYRYGYLVKTGTWYSNLSNDPYAKMTGEDGRSAFMIPQEKSARLDSFKPPSMEKLCLYYLNLDDFNHNFEGAKNRVKYYLDHLGINGVIISPLMGYDHSVTGEKIPIHYFAPDYKYGTPYDLKVMINEFHKSGIAVILDIDFSAVSTEFGINHIYPIFDNKPFLGAMDETGRKVYMDLNDELTLEFIYSVCRFWVDEYKVDGFRFLNSDYYWDSKSSGGFSQVLKKLYEYRKKGQNSEIFLFAHKPGPFVSQMLNQSHINGVENYQFIKSIHRMAENRALDPSFWKKMDVNQSSFPEENKAGNDIIKNYALNYTEDDNYHSLIVKMGVVSGERDRRGYPVGDRKNHWWKTKPYYIAQFASNGIPVIYNGQEIAENRFVPDSSVARDLPRPISWNFLSDFAGKDMFRFHQKLILLRSKFPSVRSRNFIHLFTDTKHQITAFKRYLDEENIIAAINFSNESYDVELPFPKNGFWREYMDDYIIKVEDKKAVVKLPARYGVIFYQE